MTDYSNNSNWSINVPTYVSKDVSNVKEGRLLGIMCWHNNY